MPNPLDKPGTPFQLGLMNPNPTFSKTKEGPVYRVSFELEQEDWQRFVDAETKGMLLAAHMAVTDDAGEKLDVIEHGEPEPEDAYRHEAAALWRSGFFYSRTVWEAAGTDAKFREWVRYRPSILDGAFTEVEDKSGERVNVPCHVLSADVPPERKGDYPNKPAYRCVPMTAAQHRWEHQHGYTSLLLNFKPGLLKKWGAIEGWKDDKEGIRVVMDEEELRHRAQKWFERQAMQAVAKWAESVLKKILGCERLSQGPPEAVALWAQDNRCWVLLPKVYKDAAHALQEDDDVES